MKTGNKVNCHENCEYVSNNIQIKTIYVKYVDQDILFYQLIINNILTYISFLDIRTNMYLLIYKKSIFVRNALKIALGIAIQ